MAKVKLNQDGLNPEDLVALALQIKTAMTGNANFPAANPTMMALGLLITTTQTKIAAHNSAVAAAQTALAERAAAVDALRAGLRQESSYVDNIAAGNAVIIQSAGMGVQSPRQPVPAPGQVLNLSLTAGDDFGELDVHWDPVPNTKTYEVEFATDMAFTLGVVNLKPPTKSKAVATGLTTGVRMWCRVRSTNASGTGAWSSVATKIVP
ncbi:MAG: fibronectin type III domain-containing protein [Chthoniobacteraceae bacterium]